MKQISRNYDRMWRPCGEERRYVCLRTWTGILLGPSEDHVHENYGTPLSTSQINLQAVLII